MADTTTTAYGLTKPEIGASEDTWGTKINTDLDTLDTVVNAIGGKTAAATLSYADSAKIATTATGADITGTLTSDGLTVDGNVGIGVTGPESIVHIKDSGNVTTTLQIEGAATGYAPTINFDGIVSTNADYVLGEINGSWDTHTNVVSAIRFESGADTTNKDDGLISFYTSSSGPTLVEAMRIDSSGNVGIGTDSPSTKLELDQAASSTAAFKITGNSSPGMLIAEDSGVTGQFASDTAAIYFGTTTNHPLVIRTNSTERMRIDSSGNVGIGTSSIGQKLVVDGNIQLGTSSGAGKLYLSSSSGFSPRLQEDSNALSIYTNSSERMRIDSSGRVGIGTIADQQSSAVNEGIWLAPGSNSSFSANSTPLTINRMGTGGNDRVNISLSNNGTPRADIGTLGASNGMYIAVGGSEAMRIDSSGVVRIGGQTGTLKLGNDGTYHADIEWEYNNNELAFTANNVANFTFNSNGTERMRIDSSGNLGISTTAPAEKLHIKGTNPRIYVEGDSSSYYPSIRVDGVNGGISLGTYHGGNISGTSGIVFLTGSSATDSGTERMRIDSSGNVLVGTAVQFDGSNPARLCLQSPGTGGRVINSKINTSGSANHLSFYNSIGQVGYIATSGSSTSYNTSSDYRLKTDAQPMTGASARVQALNPVNFEWIADGSRVDGFLAHEAQAVVPEAVTGTQDGMMDEEYEVTPAVYEDVVIEAVLDDEGNELEAERTEQRLVTEAVMGTRSVPDYQGIDQSKLVPLLTAALQEALTKIDDLETRLTALEG